MLREELRKLEALPPIRQAMGDSLWQRLTGGTRAKLEAEHEAAKRSPRMDVPELDQAATERLWQAMMREQREGSDD